MTKTLAVLRFELAYQLGRLSTRIYLALFLGLAAAITLAFVADARRDAYFFNAPVITFAVTVIAGIASLLITAAVAGDAATRDEHARMDALIFVTPVGKRAYLGGRFLGAFAVTALLMAVVTIALFFTTHMSGVSPALLGPFRPATYLTSYFLFAVPNAFVATAILFSIAAMTRRAMASYAGAGVMFFLVFMSEQFLAGHLGHWQLGRIADPLGYTTVRSLWRSLNPMQRNTVLGIDGLLLANRVLWIAVACTVLALAVLRFRFAHAATSGGSGPVALREVKPLPRAVLPAARRAFGFTTRMQQLLAVTKHSFHDLVASRIWWTVPVAAAVFVATAPEFLQVELGTPGAATTARVAQMLGAAELAMLVTVLIALSASVLLWNERDARIEAIMDATPVPDWLPLAGKLAALALMLVATQCVFLIAGITAQLMQGVHRIDVPVYAAILFGMQLTGYLIFAALAMVIHAVVNQKYAGNAAVILFLALTPYARELGVHHNLLLYGSAPEVVYSDMAGFGGQIGPWAWFTLYWSGWALLCGILTHLFRIRGAHRTLRQRAALARERLTRWPTAMGACALAIIAGAGGFVFYNTNVLHAYRTPSERNARRAEYERRYGKYASLPQPLLAATKIRVELYPARGTATIDGGYRLDNRTAAAIDTIHVATHPAVDTSGIRFDRGAHAVAIDDDLGYRIYALDTPLPPGGSLQMHFRVAFAPRRFTNDGRDPSVMSNGSWFENRGEQNETRRHWLPAIGYQRGREIGDPGTRAELGLPARPAVRLLSDVAARQDQRGRETIAFEAIVGTAEGQTAVAPGALRRVWTENGRRYFHYAADAPISNIWAIFSAAYAVHHATWRDVDIEIYHHPGHTANLDRMVRSARASLDAYTLDFGPYAHHQLRLAEYPSSGGGLGLSAYPGLIKYSEGFALVRPDADSRHIDLPFAVMAHEIAHQWWGHRLVPADVEGAPVLTESLAWYSAMLVVERTLGREHLMRLLDVMRHEYLAPQQTREVPLLRAVDAIDAYRTGPFAMFALRELAGVERVNAALRELLRTHEPQQIPRATSLDLYAELEAVTPEPARVLLKDLFADITFWDLRTKAAHVESTKIGRYRVTLQIEAQKLKSDASGKETRAPMADAIDVALFDAAGSVLYRQPHMIRSGAQTIAVELDAPRPPARAGIDPDHALLDRKPEDNVVMVGG